MKVKLTFKEGIMTMFDYLMGGLVGLIIGALFIYSVDPAFFKRGDADE